MASRKEFSRILSDSEMKNLESIEGTKVVKTSSNYNRTFVMLTFIVIGLSAVNVWNTALGLNINLKYNAFQMTGLVCSSILALFINVPKSVLPYSLGALFILSAGFQITHQTLSENLFAIYCMITFVIIGINAGISQTISFNISATMKENMSGYVSAGIGISGAFIFFINLLLDQFVSTRKIYDINEKKLLYLYIVCEICLVCAICLIIFNLDLSSEKNKLDDDNSNELSLSYYEIVKDSYKAIFCTFFVNWISLQLFPAVGHKKWRESHDISDGKVTILVGMFQVFDFLSRYPPLFAHIKYLKFFSFSLNKLLIANIIRLIFIPWFILNAAVDNSFFSNIYQQCVCMILFAFTNGWFNTVPFLVFIKELKKVKKSKDIEKVATCMVIALFIGLFGGIWTSYIYDLFPIVLKM